MLCLWPPGCRTVRKCRSISYDSVRSSQRCKNCNNFANCWGDTSINTGHISWKLCDINAIFFHNRSPICNIHFGSIWGLKWCKHILYQISHSTNCRGEDRIIIGRKQIDWEGVDWIDLAQERDKERDLVKSTMKLQVPYNAGNLTDWDTTFFEKDCASWNLFVCALAS